MKQRRHHNTKGLRQIKRGKTQDQVEDMERRLLGNATTTTGNSRRLPRGSEKSG